MAYDTVATIVSDAAVELGLVSSDVANPYASTDQNIILLTRLLKSLGRFLIRSYEWQKLTVQYTFTAGLANDFPADLDRIIDQTEFDQTSQRALLGPATPPTWEFLAAVPQAGSIYSIFRVANDLLAVTPTPSGTFAFEYISEYWVAVAASTTGTKAAPTVATDVLLLDAPMLVEGLKLRFMEAKGFDTSAQALTFGSALALARNKDKPGPVLSLNQSSGERLIDAGSAPSSNYGLDSGGLF